MSAHKVTNTYIIMSSRSSRQLPVSQSLHVCKWCLVVSASKITKSKAYIIVISAYKITKAYIIVISAYKVTKAYIIVISAYKVTKAY